jgi:hypothetical protein
MEKKPRLISKVEITKVIDLGVTKCMSAQMRDKREIRRYEMRGKRDYTLLRIEEGIAKRRGRPHAVVTSQSPRHC